MGLGFTMSTTGTPARTSSPSCTSAMLLPFQIVFTTAIPPMGAWMAIRSAVPGALPLRIRGAVAADLQDAHVRLRGAALELIGRFELLQRRLGLLERLL